MTDSIRNSSKKNLNLYKTFTRRMPNCIMDGFIRKVNQKINLTDDACPDFAFLKHRFFKTRPIKRFQICYIVLYSGYEVPLDVLKFQKKYFISKCCKKPVITCNIEMKW